MMVLGCIIASTVVLLYIMGLLWIGNSLSPGAEFRKIDEEARLRVQFRNECKKADRLIARAAELGVRSQSVIAAKANGPMPQAEVAAEIRREIQRLNRLCDRLSSQQEP